MRAIDMHVHLATAEWMEGSLGPLREATERHFRTEVPLRTVDEMADEFRADDVLAVLLAWDAETAMGLPPLTNDFVAACVEQHPDVFTGFDGSRTRRATDAGIAPRVQRVGGYTARMEVTPHVVVGPRGERIELGEIVLDVELFDGEVAARHRLRPALSGNPGTAAREGARQRRRFADRAATLPQLDAAIKAVETVDANVGLERPRIRIEHFDGQRVVFAHAIDQGVGLSGQASGIERKNRDRQRVLRDKVDQHHVLGAEAAGERGRVMSRCDPLQQMSGIDDVTVAAHASRSMDGDGPSATACARRRNSGTGRAAVAW